MPEVVHAVSEGERFAGDTDLTVVSCSSCHVTYAIPTSFYKSALKWRGDRTDGRGWKICCPFGHTWWYVGETETEKLRRIANEARHRAAAERDLRQHTERKLAAQKGATTKARKRHADGVCPCCKRSFKQVREHMARMHPDYDPAAHG